jgi:hypothetical protein
MSCRLNNRALSLVNRAPYRADEIYKVRVLRWRIYVSWFSDLIF